MSTLAEIEKRRETIRVELQDALDSWEKTPKHPRAYELLARTQQLTDEARAVQCETSEIDPLADDLNDRMLLEAMQALTKWYLAPQIWHPTHGMGELRRLLKEGAQSEDVFSAVKPRGLAERLAEFCEREREWDALVDRLEGRLRENHPAMKE